MKTSVKLEGLDVAVKNVAFKTEKALESVIKELEMAGLDLAGKAAMRAPVKKGDLRGSWFAVTDRKNLVNPAPDTNPESPRYGLPAVAKYEVAVGFSEIYAERQHESMTFRHELGGEAKFLENPFKEMASRYVANIGDAIRRAVE